MLHSRPILNEISVPPKDYILELRELFNDEFFNVLHKKASNL